MMAILSDVHGNLPALDAVLRRIDALGCDTVYSLGDVAGYYCQVNECIDLLRERAIPHLMGNHDRYLAAGRACPRSSSANVCLDFQRQAIRPDNLEWLSQAREALTVGDVSMVHGGWLDPVDEYLDRVEADYFRGRPGRFFFSGHTHVQVLVDFGAQTYCNPGSVGQPRDGDPRAAFAWMDRGRITLERVAYDVDSIARAMNEAGFPSYFYNNLYYGTKIGGTRP
ncbi:MAG: metallophosphoesterase family protein [Isosphaeraceae bacterium]|nr:metallophosphoesterase family protein [Isosphaeraceae bacterium]